MKFVVLICAMVLAAPALAQETPPQAAPGDCVAPTAPAKAEVMPPVEPALPSCMDAKTNVSKCGRVGTDKYNQQVDAYNAALEKTNAALTQYMDELQKYQSAATQYANCEVNRINHKMK